MCKQMSTTSVQRYVLPGDAKLAPTFCSDRSRSWPTCSGMVCSRRSVWRARQACSLGRSDQAARLPSKPAKRISGVNPPPSKNRHTRACYLTTNRHEPRHGPRHVRSVLQDLISRVRSSMGIDAAGHAWHGDQLSMIGGLHGVCDVAMQRLRQARCTTPDATSCNSRTVAVAVDPSQSC